VKAPATRTRAESSSIEDTAVANTSAARVMPAWATSCSAVVTCLSKSAANLGVMTSRTCSRYSGIAPEESTMSGS
jgi:hypothetical protein